MCLLLLICSLIPGLINARQEYIHLSDQISAPFIKQYSKKYNVHPFGLGGGMMDDVDSITMVFSSYNCFKVPQARRLFVKGMEDVLNRYNENLTIRPYLHDFPITTDNIKFSLVFQSDSGRAVSSDYVTSVYCNHDTIYYEYYDHKTEKLVMFFEEPYANAVTLVQQEEIPAPVCNN